MNDSRLEMTAAYEWGWEKGVAAERERIIALLETCFRRRFFPPRDLFAEMSPPDMNFLLALIKGEQK